MVIRRRSTALAAVLMATLAGRVAFAQTPAPAPAPAPSPAPSPQGGREMRIGIPLQVQVVVSRSKGEKGISRVPYRLVVNAGAAPFAGRPSQLRVGAELPMPAAGSPGPGGGPGEADARAAAGGATSPRYRAFGTNIDCAATATADGRFVVSLAIEESSPYPEGQLAGAAARPGAEPPVLRSLRFSNEVTLRDGQSTQFAQAIDRVSGETIEIDVTIALVK